MNTSELSFALLGRKRMESPKFIKDKYQAIKSMIRGSRVLYNSAKDDKTGLKKASITQATQVTPLQNPNGSKLEKK